MVSSVSVWLHATDESLRWDETPVPRASAAREGGTSSHGGGFGGGQYRVPSEASFPSVQGLEDVQRFECPRTVACVARRREPDLPARVEAELYLL